MHVRRGLVLGAGGVLGFTWTVGALHALEQSLGMDVRDMDVIVGTSAGSIMAAVLSNDVPLDTVLRHQRGRVRPGDVEIDWNYDSDSGGALPPLPLLGLGSPQLLARVARHPSRFPPITAATALLPRGRGRLAPVTNMVERIGSASWPERETWIVALDYATGRRTVFGQQGAPGARLSEAVDCTSTAARTPRRRSTCWRAVPWTRCSLWRRWQPPVTTSRCPLSASSSGASGVRSPGGCSVRRRR